MSNAQHDRPAGSGAPGRDWRNRRPYRSANDRKIAGVAGGLGRAFRVDPVLFRVGFVILLFTGFGLLLYVLGWLLLPADGDEVSPGEALIGRGRSATPPVLAVGLGIVAIFSIAGIFSWGIPVAPLVIGGIITVVVLRKRGRMGGCARHNGPAPRAGTAGDCSTRMSRQGESWGAQAEQWVARQPWSGTPTGKDGAPSPFEKPAFWDEDGHAAPGSSTAANATGGPAAGKINLSKEPAEPTPPAWDPLGVAPFAWDLPEPTPLPPAPPARRDRGVIGRVTMGAVLLIGGLATAGIFASWWQLSWAGVSATALAVVGIGLLIGSLRGRGQWLIGPGIFLSALTLALTVTGISGTDGYGQQSWTPTTPAAVQSEYVLNGGQGQLDLRRLTVPANTTVDTSVEVRAGQASVIVPENANVTVTCSTNAGEVDCLGNVESGLHRETTATQQGSSDVGTINLNVHVGAGHAEVRHG